jgi:putative hemolysin
MNPMSQIADDAVADESPQEVRFSYSGPEQRWLNRSVIRGIELLTGQRRLEHAYREWSQRPGPETIFDAGVRTLGVRIDTDRDAWSRLPQTGSMLIIANHPYGVVDGLVMGHLVGRTRPDFKMMVHQLLCQPPEARDYLLPVDFDQAPEARRRTAMTRRRALDWLAGGHVLIVFPSGSVATSQSPFGGPVLEPAWYPFVAKLARASDRVVPAFIHGGNSRAFQLASHLHYSLRLALMFRETLRLSGKTIRVDQGEILDRNVLNRVRDREEMLRCLRTATLSMSGPSGPDPLLEFRWPSHIRWN